MRKFVTFTLGLLFLLVAGMVEANPPPRSQGDGCLQACHTTPAAVTVDAPAAITVLPATFEQRIRGGVADKCNLVDKHNNECGFKAAETCLNSRAYDSSCRSFAGQ